MKRVVIGSKLLAPVVVLVLFGGIALSATFGYWKTTSTKEPAKIRSGEFAGLPSPSDIRGSYTWEDVSRAFGIPAALLAEAFGSSSTSAKVNSLEAAWAGKLPAGVEIGTDSVRLFVSLYTGLPHVGEEGTILPAGAIPALRAAGKAAPELIEAAAAKAFAPLDPVTAPAPAAAPAPAPAASEGAASAAPAKSAPAAALSTAPASAPSTAPAPAATPSAAAPAAPVAASPGAKGQGASASPPAEGEVHTQPAGTITGKTTFYDLKSWGLDMKKVEELLGGLGASGESVRDYAAAKGLSFGELKTKLQELAPKP